MQHCNNENDFFGSFNSSSNSPFGFKPLATKSNFGLPPTGQRNDVARVLKPLISISANTAHASTPYNHVNPNINSFPPTSSHYCPYFKTSTRGNAKGTIKRSAPIGKKVQKEKVPKNPKKEKKDFTGGDKKKKSKTEKHIFNDEDAEDCLRMLEEMKEEPKKEEMPSTPEKDRWVNMEVDRISGLELFGVETEIESVWNPLISIGDIIGNCGNFETNEIDGINRAEEFESRFFN